MAFIRPSRSGCAGYQDERFPCARHPVNRARHIVTARISGLGAAVRLRYDPANEISGRKTALKREGTRA